jgi:hypothetical protein
MRIVSQRSPTNQVCALDAIGEVVADVQVLIALVAEHYSAGTRVLADARHGATATGVKATHYESKPRSSAARFSQTLRTGSNELAWVESDSTVSPKSI